MEGDPTKLYKDNCGGGEQWRRQRAYVEFGVREAE